MLGAVENDQTTRMLEIQIEEQQVLRLGFCLPERWPRAGARRLNLHCPAIRGTSIDSSGRSSLYKLQTEEFDGDSLAKIAD